MKRFFLTLILLVAATVGGAFWLSGPGQSPEPRSVLQKAIQAHGGEKNISKPRMGVLKGSSESDGAKIIQEETFDIPGRWKRTTVGTFEGQKKIGYDVMIDGTLWQWEPGGEIKKTEAAQSASLMDVLWMLVNLNQDHVKLVALNRIRVTGQPAFGFRATWDGSAVDCYFDKETGLLAQSTLNWQPPAGKAFVSKTIFSDYKEVDGIKFPFRKTTYLKATDSAEFKLTSDFVITELKLLDAVPKDAFVLPGEN